MDRLPAWVSVAILGALACLAAVSCRPADPAANPALSEPPPLVTEAELGDRKAVFDGRTTDGWRVEGPYQVRNATLEIGGEEPATAALLRPLEEGQTLEFDFFQQGPAETKLWVQPTLITPQPPDPEFCKEFSYDLNLSGFAYRRWHHVKLTASRQGTNTEVKIETVARPDGRGKGGSAVHSLPARGGCRHALEFRVAARGMLLVRNVLARKAG